MKIWAIASVFALVVGCGGGHAATGDAREPQSAAGASSAEPAPSASPAAADRDAGASVEPVPSAVASAPPVADAGAPEADAAGSAAPSFDMSTVESVFKEHKDALRAACWDHAKGTEKAYIATATIRLSPTGKVISSQTDGTDAAASKCIDKQIKGWKFPPPSGTASIKLPIRLRRD